MGWRLSISGPSGFIRVREQFGGIKQLELGMNPEGARNDASAENYTSRVLEGPGAGAPGGPAETLTDGGEAALSSWGLSWVSTSFPPPQEIWDQESKAELNIELAA